MTDGQFEKIASCESVVKTYLLWYLDGKNASPGSVQMEPNASQGRKWLFTWAGALTIERLLALQEMKSSFHLSWILVNTVDKVATFVGASTFPGFQIQIWTGMGAANI